jgi:hypothetical protein
MFRSAAISPGKGAISLRIHERPELLRKTVTVR